MVELLWKIISQFLKKINMYYYTTRQLHSWMFIPPKWRQCSHKNLYNNVFRCFTCNIQKLETTQMSSNGWMVRQTVSHPYHGILLINKLQIYTTTWKNLRRTMLSEKHQSQRLHGIWFLFFFSLVSLCLSGRHSWHVGSHSLEPSLAIFPRFSPGHENRIGTYIHPSPASVDASCLLCYLAKLWCSLSAFISGSVPVEPSSLG